jgi:hypothetical protein
LATIGHDPERFWLKTSGSYKSWELARGNRGSMKLPSGNRSSQELRESEAFGRPVDQKPKGFWKEARKAGRRKLRSLGIGNFKSDFSLRHQVDLFIKSLNRYI